MRIVEESNSSFQSPFAADADRTRLDDLTKSTVTVSNLPKMLLPMMGHHVDTHAGSRVANQIRNGSNIHSSALS